jgi:putative inorganic carbon (hco3(-)) transporter
MIVYYGILAFFVLEYARPAVYFPPLMLLHLNSLVPLAVAAVAIASAGHRTNEQLRQDMNTRLLVVLLTLVGLSVVTADVTLYAYEIFTIVFGYGLMFWTMAKHVGDRQRIKGIFKALVLIHALVVGLNPQILFSGERLYLQGAPFLGDGNDFALSANIVVPLCLFLMFDAAKVRRRIVFAALLVLFLAAIIGTQSRGGTLGLIAVGIYFWLKSDRKVVTAMIAVVAVVAVFALAPPQYFARMNDITNTQEGSAEGRMLTWNAAVRMALDHPLTGVGAGHFAVKYGAEYRTRTDVPWQTAHSIYFLTLGELGFPGIIVLLWFFIGNLLANRRLAAALAAGGGPEWRRHARLLAATSAALIAFAVNGAFLSVLYYPHIFVLAALLTVSRHLAEEGLKEASLAGPAVPTPAVTCHWALQPSATGRRGL